ncbi:unnamed protein product [Cylindrotheca closterium]|uniref:Uncharacterized protein n=1 Tax=Cylindrotheca closterium TaxID=2856 RepID=A0AAD2G6P5_9STRA|nr:unnamed protein product [Cylindrotheca closterium]
MILANPSPTVDIAVERVLKRSRQHSPATVQTKKRKQTVVKNLTIKASDYVQAAFKANGFAVDTVRQTAEPLFREPTKEMLASYIPEVLDAIRKNDLERVKKLHKSGVLTGNGCNKFGESTFHLACRRGHTEIVKYLLNEVKFDMNVRDDYNRNPLHDACWTAEPEFELVDLLLRIAPHQLVMEDVRGFTPFDYIRAETNGKWLRFLWERRAILRPLEKKANHDEMTTASVLASLRK